MNRLLFYSGTHIFMNKLDLNSLSLFLTLYQEGSTQRAALKLKRSQSFVSKALAQLRDDLSDPLFVRTAKGLEPTSYASNIAPKVKEALALMHSALEPESFNPLALDKITIHLAAPLIIPIGKQLIKKIMLYTPAIVELREWSSHSEQFLLDEEIDIAVHALNERPQALYQKKVMSVSGQFVGNRSGKFVKTIIDNYNEHYSLCQLIDADIKPSIIIDNHYLAEQLMDEHFSYGPVNDEKNNNTPTDIALICKATRKHDPKVQWLMSLTSPILKQAQW